MGLLVRGQWQDRWYDTEKNEGRFERKPAAFHGVVSEDGASPHPVESDRYHLYISLACPWAHRTLIVRELLGLQAAVGVSVVDPRMGPRGWEFGDFPGGTGDRALGSAALHEVYTLADPEYTGRVTVPVLWDSEARTIVNNESSEIIRLFNGPMRRLGSGGPELYPRALRSDIDAVNEVVYGDVNNGVYRAGFATTQSAYEEAVERLFSRLDQLERRLSRQRYLVGDQITEADWRLFTTLIRFDAVYHGHFKCNIRRIVDYPALWGYTRELFQRPGVAATTSFEHIKTHYYWSHTSINPTRVVPSGPELELSEPHGRDRLASAGVALAADDGADPC